MNQKYNEFRDKYKKFIYDSYEYIVENDILIIKYEFTQYDGLKFNPTFSFPIDIEKYNNKSKDFLDLIIFNLGMVELISYWKATCSKNVEIRCGNLNTKQINWWKKLYFNGLGEFFYINKIETNIEDFMSIEVIFDKPLKNITIKDEFLGSLIPIGGGKDSIVTLESFRKFKNTNAYIINPRGATIDTILTAGDIDSINAKRTIDNNLIDLVSKGYLNGHTPFSAIVAFSSYLVAYIYSKKYIILSNESSANESNVAGSNINHQYSKTIEFENDFREYVKDNLSDKIEYFSFLRHLNEYRIVEKFTKYDKYFKIFKSCNVGSKENVWCLNCPKCLYVYIMISAFLEEKEVIEIFGRNMFDDISLMPILNGLVSDKFDKPFECVGTKIEINYALYKTITNIQKSKKELPKLLNQYLIEYIDIFNSMKTDKIKEEVESYFDIHNNIPNEFKELM